MFAYGVSYLEERFSKIRIAILRIFKKNLQSQINVVPQHEGTLFICLYWIYVSKSEREKGIN